ncbi:helix-turn-helix domain-containing protein [Fibrobacter sp.]|uniref:helix-turn-helix domain-containing protein n=1 Tax=Fibrobacter sp. TaxID=35828 RepID=UPI00388D2E5C
MEELYARFKMHFPVIEETVVSCRKRSNQELILDLSDGISISYYDRDNSIHRLPNPNEPLTVDDYKIEFGRRLYRMMDERHVTQEWLAAATGITQHTISDYVTGKVSPSYYNVDKIAKALGCSMDVFRYF